MKNLPLIYLAAFILILLAGCTKENPQDVLMFNTQLDSEINQTAYLSSGVTRISGVGYYADASDCNYPDEGADFALLLTGDLEGCLFAFVEEYDCSPSGTYRESGKEYFVGTYKGESGTFWTTYKFEAKFEGCEDGFFVGAEIFGRCQHPIVDGSGTGVFEGARGRLDFKDDIEAGDFPFRGHIGYK